MRDDERSSALEQHQQRLLDELFHVGRDGTGRLVEDDNGGVFDHDAGKTDQLLFAGREPFAPLGELFIIAARQPLDALVGKDGLGGGDAFFVRRVRPAVADIVDHRSLEDERVLHEHAHLAAQRFEVDIAHVGAVDANAPLFDVVKAGQKVDDRRLARARRPHQSDALARLYMQVEVFEDVHPLFVREGHVVEVDLAAHVAEVDIPLFIGDARGGVDGLEDALEVRRHLRQVLDDLRKLRQRGGEQPHIAEEGDDHARGDAHGARLHEQEGDGVEHDRAVVPEQAYDGRVQLVAADDAHPRFGAALLQVVVHLFVIDGAVVVLDDLFAHDRFDDEGGAVGDLGAVGAEQLADGAADEKDPRRQGNDRRIDDRRQHGAEHQHEHRDDDDLGDVHDKIHQVVGEKVGKFGDVLGDAHGDLAGGAVVEIIERQLLQAVKDIVADVGDDAVPRPAHAALLVEGDDDLRHAAEDEPAHHGDEFGIFSVYLELRHHGIDDVLQ